MESKPTYSSSLSLMACRLQNNYGLSLESVPFSKIYKTFRKTFPLDTVRPSTLSEAVETALVWHQDQRLSSLQSPEQQQSSLLQRSDLISVARIPTVAKVKHSLDEGRSSIGDVDLLKTLKLNGTSRVLIQTTYEVKYRRLHVDTWEL